MFGGLFRKQATTVQAPQAPSAAEAPPPPPPPPLYSGVPTFACCLSVDPVQQTVAIGSLDGSVHIVSGSTEQRLLPPPGVDPHPVVQCMLVANEGRLLVLHAPALLHVWSLQGDSAALIAATKLSSSVVTVGHAVPRSPFAFFGTDDGTILACDVATGALSDWSLSVASSAGTGPLCALELRPADSSLRLLVGVRRGRLLAQPISSPGNEDARHVLFAEHPEAAGLCCACWIVSEGGAGGTIAAGYDSGDLLILSLRNPGSATHRLQASSIGMPLSNVHDPAHSEASSTPPRRAARAILSVGSSSGAGLLVVGGTTVEAQPDGVVLLKGTGFRERSLIAPPSGGVLSAVPTGVMGAPLLPNASPAQPESLLLLTTRGQLLSYSLRTVGSAPTRFPDALLIASNDEELAAHPAAPRVRLVLTAW